MHREATARAVPRREQELETLLEIAQAVSSALSLKQVLRLIALRTAQACQVDRCSVLLFDTQKKKLVPLMSQFASGRVDKELWRVFRERTYVETVDQVPAVREVIRERKPVILDKDSGLDALPRQWVEPFGIRALLAVPLISRDEVIGMMTLDYTREDQGFAPWQADLAVTIGTQVAVFIENARLYEEAQARSGELAAINSVIQALNASRDVRQVFNAVARELRGLIQFDRASIALAREGEEHFTIHVLSDQPGAPLGEGIVMPLSATAAAADVMSGRAHITEDLSAELDYPAEKLLYEAGYRSRVNVPLRLGDQLIGALNLASTRPAAFSQREVDLLQQVAGPLAAALEKAHLFEQLERSEARYRHLVENVHDVIFELDAQGTITYCSPAVEELTGFAPQELLRRHFTDFVHPDELPHLLRSFARAQKGQVEPVEFRLRTRDGQLRWARGLSRPLQKDGQVAGLVGVLSDITERKLAEEALRESREMFRKIFVTQRDAIFLLSGKTPARILDCNPAATEMFGYSREEMLGRTTDFLHVDQGALREFRQHLYRAVAEHDFLHLPEFRMKRKDGTIFFTEHSVAPLEDEQGKRIGWVSVVRDITQGKRSREMLHHLNAAAAAAQRAARTPEAVFQAVGQELEQLGLQNVIALLDREKRQFVIRYISSGPPAMARAQKMLQKTLGIKLVGYTFPVEKMNIYRQVLETGQAVCSTAVGDAVGQILPAPVRRLIMPAIKGMPDVCTISAPLIVSGELIGILSVGSRTLTEADLPAITAFANQMAAALESAQLYQQTKERAVTLAALHETALDLVSQRALPDLLQAIVARAVELLHAKGGAIYFYRPASDDLELTLTYRLEPDFTGAVLKRGEGLSGKVLEAGQAMAVEDYSRWEGRSPQYEGADFTACVAVPIRWADRVLGVLNVLDNAPRTFSPEDVGLLERFTPLAAAALEQARLLEEERRRRQEAETLRQAAAAVTESLGLDVTLERILKELERVVPYDSASVMLVQEGALRVVGARGFPDEATPLDVSFPGGDDSFFREVSQTLQPLILEDAQADPRFRRLGRTDYVRGWICAPLVVRDKVIGVLTVDSRQPGAFDEGHARLVQTFGHHAAVALENARLHEEVRRQRDFAQSILTTASSLIVGLDLDGRVILFNDQCVRTTGWTREEALGRDWFQTFLPERVRRPVHQVFRDVVEIGAHSRVPLPSQYVNPILTKAGEERVVAWSHTVLRDSEGRPTSVIAIGQDITEQQRLEEQLRQAQKMEAIGTLAGGIAHDFNNLLGSILGFASLVERELPPDSPLRPDVATIINSARHGAQLTNQLLAFAKGGRYQVGPVDMNAVVDEVVRLLSRTVDKAIRIEPRLAPDLAAVEGDAGQLHQMLLNLCLNARDAMPAGGVLTIETRNVTLSAEDVRGEADLSPRRYVYLRVSDTGVGMDPETKQRIFEPFFTTKKGRPGEKHSGLGLAMVYGIVRGHQGAIRVHSELGQGSTFEVYLPATARPARPAASMEGEVRGGTETVLVVDDEPDILSLLGRVLGKHGYTVLLAESGPQALEMFRERRDEIDLVVLDLIMPEMSGVETFHRLRELDPDVRVLLSSGYSEEGQARELLAAGAQGFLQKPYDFRAVLRKVRQVLDAGEQT